MYTDPISDLLTRIRNAYRARKETIVVPASKIKIAIVELLVESGYVKQMEITHKPFALMKLTLHYRDNQPTIRSIMRVSTPGRRVYVKHEELKPVRDGFGISIISTSQGLMTNVEARKKGLGGEVLCEVY